MRFTPIYVENSGHKCEYGCNTDGHYKFKNGKWCCSDNWKKCRFIAFKKVEYLERMSHDPIFVENSGRLCEYCNVKEAKYSPGKGLTKWCCEKDCKLCEKISSSKSSKMKNNWSDPDSKLNDKKTLEKRRIGVQKSWDNDPERRVKLSEWNRINWNNENSFFHSKETREKISKTSIEKWKSEEFRKKFSESMTYTIEQWQEKHPTFAKVEEMRYNPDKPREREIQVHCKNHNCPNSKEQGGWFTPTKIQFSERITALENKRGSDGSYFYCCDECKNKCPLYNLNLSSYINKFNNLEEITAPGEYLVWRQEVLKRQFNELGHNECEICGNRELKELEVHHEKPQKTHPEMSLDPDNGIILCGHNSVNKCHYKYGHKSEDGCSTGQLANKICFKV